MSTFIFSFLFMALVMSAMAIGLILKNKPIKGTCASLSNLESLGEQGECMICGRKPDEISDCESTSESESMSEKRIDTERNKQERSKKADYYSANL